MKVGNDIVDVKRFFELVLNKKFVERVFTEAEQAHIKQAKDRQKQAERMAGKFSAKEAVLKALGCGISEGVSLKEIEILPDEKGAPKVHMFGECLSKFNAMKEEQIEVSISNTAEYATAVCVLM